MEPVPQFNLPFADLAGRSDLCRIENSHPIPFESAPIPITLAELGDRIRTAHQRAQADPFAAMLHARSAGEWLLLAEAQLSGAQWWDWLHFESPVSETTARTYMEVARTWPRLDPLHFEIVGHSTPLPPVEIEATLEVSEPPTPDPPEPFAAESRRDEEIATRDRPKASSNSLVFFIAGGVVPKARPRVTTNGTFLPKRYRTWRNRAEVELYRQLSERYGEWELPIQRAIVKLRFVGRHRQNSDVDNLAGSCLDALSGRGAGVLRDDRLSCVPKLTAEYVPGSEETGVWIEIEPLAI
jgi:Holliday junction resolvase RusA-like endonuclease